MTVTNVRWTLDQRGRRMLDLVLDGHPAHIHSSQKTELLHRGMVAGIVFCASDRAAQVSNIQMHGDGEAARARNLVGATNDPQVFALYQDMSEGIRRDTWPAGPRPATVAEPNMDPLAPQDPRAVSTTRSGQFQGRTTAPSAPWGTTPSHQGISE
jgi:hypothetical protein